MAGAARGDRRLRKPRGSCKTRNLTRRDQNRRLPCRGKFDGNLVFHRRRPLLSSPNEIKNRARARAREIRRILSRKIPAPGCREFPNFVHVSVTRFRRYPDLDRLASVTWFFLQGVKGEHDHGIKGQRGGVGVGRGTNPRVGEARILMHAANLPGIPRSRGEKEHDVVAGEGGSWDAPGYFRLGSSYGGAGRNQHGRQPASELDDRRREPRAGPRHRPILSSGFPRRELALHHSPGKRSRATRW